MSVNLIFLSGSCRKASLNKKLAQNACDMAKKLGATVEHLDLADYDMPIYNEDLEKATGLPEAAKRLKEKFMSCDGFFIASPEYNSSLTPLLKNSIDWMSRKENDDEPNLVAYSCKVAAISAASPGAYGGLRGLVPLRMVLGNIGVTVIPQQLALGSAHKFFDEEDQLNNKQKIEALHDVIENFVHAARALKNRV